MRLNQFLARHTALSRRDADKAIESGRVKINDLRANLGDSVHEIDTVRLDGAVIKPAKEVLTIMLNKPKGFVCSRKGQGNKTIYELLPVRLHQLNPVGRLDKDTTGLLLMTDDGGLANRLTHPSYGKEKVYEVELSRPLAELDGQALISGVDIGDNRPSKFLGIEKISDKKFKIVLGEGRNRQIRRTFEALGYEVVKLHRIKFGEYQLNSLKNGDFSVIVI